MILILPFPPLSVLFLLGLLCFVSLLCLFPRLLHVFLEPCSHILTFLFSTSTSSLVICFLFNFIFFLVKWKVKALFCFHFFLVPFFCYFIIFYSIFSFFLFVSLNHSHQPLFFSYCYPIIQSSTEGFGSLPSVLTLLLCASKAVCACVCEILCTCVKQCVCIHVRVSSRG